MHLSPRQPDESVFRETESDSIPAGGKWEANGTSGRFVIGIPFLRKLSFTKMNAKSGDSELESISQFFHILGSVDSAERLPVKWQTESMRLTLYTSCGNASKGIYYYTTYERSSDHCCGSVPAGRNLNGT